MLQKAPKIQEAPPFCPSHTQQIIVEHLLVSVLENNFKHLLLLLMFTKTFPRSFGLAQEYSIY
jgi:hypothetical protein